MKEKSIGSAMYWAKLRFDVELGSRGSKELMLLRELGSNECEVVVCGIHRPPAEDDDGMVADVAAAEVGVVVGGSA